MTSSELIARPAQQPGAGDADVTGVSIAPRVTVACRRPRLSLRLAWLIRALGLIRGTGIPLINRITRILHAKRSTFSVAVTHGA